MPDLSRYRALRLREQALVCIAVLLDGLDASDYLSSEKERKSALQRAAQDLASLSPDLRIPLSGTLLREVLPMLEDEPFVIREPSDVKGAEEL